MDFVEKLSEIDQLIFEAHYTQAVASSGQALEELLRHLYRNALPKLSATDQKELAERIQQIGGDKTVDKLTLGQLVAIFRDTKLFEKFERSLNLNLARLRRADLTTLTDTRNRAAHDGIVEEDDARLVVSQVRVIVREAGLLQEKAGAKQKATAESLQPWTKFVRLNEDVDSGNTAMATYAIDLGGVIAGDKSAPKIYRDAETFFRLTYPTSSLIALMNEVLARLAGKPGDRVLQLRSPFGGGKSHLLLALYHAVNDRQALLGVWHEAKSMPDPERVRVAVFDGEKFDVQGKEVAKGIRIKTLWGWIAWHLGGESLYQLVAYHDERKISPGGDLIYKLLGRDEPNPPPTLILLDEVLKYFERAQAETEVVGQSTLGRQTLDFIQSLSTEVANSSNALMIYSLQASAHEAFDNTALLNILDHLTSRVDAKREPIKGDEILPVLQRRLLAKIADENAAERAAVAYEQNITLMRKSHASDAATRRVVEDEGNILRKRIRAAYPFHPILISIMSERWAALPDFQRTRGALRFLATCLHALKRDDKARPLLGPGDIPMYDAEVRNAFFTEVGQREPFQAVLLHDFTGPNAVTRRIDERMAREHSHLSGVHPATRLATAILMYSFGGLSRAGESEGEPMGPGVSETELLSAVISPDLDSITAQATLKELREQCLYLHFDGARYGFKTTPNVNQMLEQEAENVRTEELSNLIKQDLMSRLAGRAAIVWPNKSMDIPDSEPRFVIAYLPLDFAQLGDAKQEEMAIEFFSKYSDGLRKYRNALALAIPDVRQIETLRRAAKYRKAIELLQSKRQAVGLSREQLAQLKEREATENNIFSSGLQNLYNTLWLPQISNSALVPEKLGIGGRPLAAAGLHERLMELVTIVTPRVFAKVTPTKIIELFRLGEQSASNESATLGVTTQQLVDTFFGSIGFPRLENESVLRRAIAAGVKDGTFGFVGRADRIDREKLREGSGYFVGRGQAVIGKELREDEIDLSAGCVVLPAGIEAESAPSPDGTTPIPPPPVPPPPGIEYTVKSTGKDAGTVQTRVRFKVTLNRQQVYASFNAIANLADKAGTIEVIVDAQALQGFDPVWLRNAVIEPLEEADVKIEETSV